VAVRDGASGQETVTLALVQSGNTLSGTLMTGSRSLHSDRAAPADLGTAGEFRIALGHSAEVMVDGRPDASGERLIASVHGLETHPVTLIFTRP
jgi:hypothetical protein